VTAYLRVSPLIDEHKAAYSDGQFRAFLHILALAARQPDRGRFRSEAQLRALLGRLGRHVPHLLAEGDLEVQADGALVVHGWDVWQEGDMTVRDRMAALRNRRRNATVTDTVTSTVTQPSPTATRISSSVSTSSRVTPTDRTPPRAPRQVTLSKEQLEAWRSFGPAWDPFKAAWLGRGFLYPPSGDPDGGEDTQRGLLWQVLDARPSGIAEWVRAAPKGSTARAVVQYVLDRFHEVRAAVSDEPPARDFAPTKSEAAESVGAIAARMAAKATA
jgi:hypothetical protein